MPTNDFLPFCGTDTGTNLESQATYLADANRSIGNQPGIASSKFVNKAIRQACWIASQFCQYMVNVTGQSILDDQNSTNILATMTAALTSGSNIQKKTSAYTAAAKDFVICSSASFNVTLPDATAAGVSGLSVTIKHNGTSLTQIYTILTTGGQTISGSGGAITSGNFALYTAGETLTVVSDGLNWTVINHGTETVWTAVGANVITATSAYVFTIVSSSVTAGAIYSNNGNQYVVSATIVSSTTMNCAANGTPGNPLASGTLTLVSGTGPATIAFSAVANSVPAKGATPVTDATYWRRVGTNIEYRSGYQQTTTGTGGSGDYLWEMPAGVSIDLTKLNAFLAVGNTDQLNNCVGVATVGNHSGPSAGPGVVAVFDATHLKVAARDNSTALYNFVSGSFFNLAGPNCYDFTCSMPVVGWQP